jgi:hypothetical protein
MINWLTAFVALIVAFIAALQWVTARQKLVLDLFDKRYEVYEELFEAINEYFTQSPAGMKYIGKFTRAAGRAQLLFGPEIEITSFLEARRRDLNDDLNPRTIQDQKSQKTDGKHVRTGWSLVPIAWPTFLKTSMCWLHRT